LWQLQRSKRQYIRGWLAVEKCRAARAVAIRVSMPPVQVLLTALIHQFDVAGLGAFPFIHHQLLRIHHHRKKNFFPTQTRKPDLQSRRRRFADQHMSQRTNRNIACPLGSCTSRWLTQTESPTTCGKILEIFQNPLKVTFHQSFRRIGKRDDLFTSLFLSLSLSVHRYHETQFFPE
jgi:hypothetical protein